MATEQTNGALVATEEQSEDRSRKRDPELLTIERVQRELDTLEDTECRQRVLSYLAQRNRPRYVVERGPLESMEMRVH